MILLSLPSEFQVRRSGSRSQAARGSMSDSAITHKMRSLSVEHRLTNIDSKQSTAERGLRNAVIADHCSRKATTGSTRIALRTGSNMASPATTINTRTAAIHAKGSIGEISKI